MTYDPERHHRRSIRLQNYDYASPGAYYITLCVKNRECLFGEIVDGTMRLNPYGTIVNAVWHGLPNHYPHVELDAWVIMPNHVHGIIVLADTPVGAGFKPAPTDPAKPAPTATPTKRHGLPEIVRAFKTFSARRINDMRKTPGTSIWQRNYYEHIVRSEASLNRIRHYIINNPTRWAVDHENPLIRAHEPQGSKPR